MTSSTGLTVMTTGLLQRLRDDPLLEEMVGSMSGSLMRCSSAAKQDVSWRIQELRHWPELRSQFISHLDPTPFTQQSPGDVAIHRRGATAVYWISSLLVPGEELKHSLRLCRGVPTRPGNVLCFQPNPRNQGAQRTAREITFPAELHSRISPSEQIRFNPLHLPSYCAPILPKLRHCQQRNSSCG